MCFLLFEELEKVKAFLKDRKVRLNPLSLKAITAYVSNGHVLFVKVNSST